MYSYLLLQSSDFSNKFAFSTVKPCVAAGFATGSSRSTEASQRDAVDVYLQTAQVVRALSPDPSLRLYYRNLS